MRRRKSPIPGLPTLILVASLSLPTAPAEPGRPTAIPFVPMATGTPIFVTYRVQRSEPLSPAPRAYDVPPPKQMSWTPSGARSAGDFGVWTYERDRRGHWSSEFAQPRRGEGARALEWRYRADGRGPEVEIRPLHDAAEGECGYGPPAEFVVRLSECTLPHVLSAPGGGTGSPEPLDLSTFLSSLDESDARRTERGWEISAPVRRGLAILPVEADEQGRLLRIEETSVRRRHDGPVLREVIEVDEVRILGDAQMPWRFVRTVYDGPRVWERLEYEVIEAIPGSRGSEQASLD